MRDAWNLKTNKTPDRLLVCRGFCFLAALAAFGPTGLLRFWVYIRCCGCCRWRFRSYSESPFSDAKKVTQKALPRRTARSLKLGVPSLRDRSGRSGYGLLRCTSFRCVRLRRTVAALPHPDRSRNEACRRGKRSKAEAKQKPDQEPDQKIAAFGGSYSWIECYLKTRSAVGPPSRAGSLPQKQKQSSAAARGEAAPFNNER